MEREEAGRDIDLRSRPGLLKLGVTTWILGPDLGQAAWACRDQRTPSKRATCAGCASDMRSTSLLCSQKRPLLGHWARSVRSTWVLGVRTVHTTQFCDSALFRVTVWTLFMDIVHEYCSKVKKKYQIFKNFLVYDLLYEIFIL